MSAVRRAEPASFRDPASTIFYENGRVRRGLSAAASADFRALEATAFYQRRVQDGSIVGTFVVEGAESREWRLVLEHDRIPFVSYPYEWTFSMMREAALLHLELLLDALSEGLTLKDGYAYNLQWQGSAPVFIDVPSFERDPAGGPWVGYRQFCQTMLYPLLLVAYKDVDFQPWLRGRLEGIEASNLTKLMSARDMVRPGVLKHVVLHAALASRFTSHAQAMRNDLRGAGFSADLARASVEGLQKLVRGLRWRRSESHWTSYRATCSYSDADRLAKEAFVKECVAGRPTRLAWDLGCNDGAYARLLSEHVDYVVAVDSDPVVIDRFWRALRTERNPRILPLVFDLIDPSPDLGWRGRERPAFAERGQPDLVLALALFHHLVISGNVPLVEVLEWIRSLDARLIVEFAHPEDPKVQQLLANKPAGQHHDYTIAVFEQLLSERFAVECQMTLPSRTRTIYCAHP